MSAVSDSAPESCGLQQDELLVRDGASKLFLCWIGWTLAQNHQCKIGVWHDSRLARALWKRISATTKGHGFKTPPGESRTPTTKSGISALLTEKAMEKVLLDEATPTLQGLAERLPELREMFAWNPGNIIATMFGECLIKPTWERVNAPGFTVPTSITKGVTKASDTWTTEQLRKSAPVGRMLWGSSTSMERTTLRAFTDGESLDKFQETPPDDDTPQASPIPVRLLLRWAMILGFGPVISEQSPWSAAHDKANELPQGLQPVWRAFCGKDGAPLRGDTLEAFAVALQNLLDPPFQVQDFQKEKVTIQKNKKLGESGNKNTASSQVREPNRGPQVELDQKHPEGYDRINLRVLVKDGRVRLEEVTYQLDHQDDGAKRVCLKELTLEWVWGDSRNFQLADDYNDSARRPELLRNDNPGIRVPYSRNGGTFFTVRLQPGETGAVLCPDPDVAVESLTMPAGRFGAQDEVAHRFRLLCRKQDLCIAHRDEDGVLKPREDQPDILRTQTEAISELVDIAYIEVYNSFPPNGELLELGHRIAHAKIQSGPQQAGVGTAA